jgi:RHS repeat-associated protein
VARVKPRQYEYDEENRLTAVKQYDGTPLLEMSYDALGRRVETIDYTAGSEAQPVSPCGTASPVTTRHIYSGLETIEEYVCCDTGNPACGGSEDWSLAREFVWGDQFPEPVAVIDHTDLGDKAATTPEVLHYVRDALGSVVGLTDAGDPDATPDPIPAKEVERYVYDPYGHTYVEHWTGAAWVRTTASVYGHPFAWTGQRYDAGVGLYAFYARTYSPELGRWLQRDLLGYIDGVNLYEYVRSGPTRWLDAYGLARDEDIINAGLERDRQNLERARKNLERRRKECADIRDSMMKNLDKAQKELDKWNQQRLAPPPTTDYPGGKINCPHQTEMENYLKGLNDDMTNWNKNGCDDFYPGQFAPLRKAMRELQKDWANTPKAEPESSSTPARAAGQEGRLPGGIDCGGGIIIGSDGSVSIILVPPLPSSLAPVSRALELLGQLLGLGAGAGEAAGAGAGAAAL